MDSKTNLPVNYESDRKESRQWQTATKLFAAVAVALGLAAIAGLCAVLAVTLPAAYNRNADLHVEEGLEDKERLHSKILDDHIYKRTSNSNPDFGASCYSNATNSTTPIARIEGRGFKWGTVAPIHVGGYVSNWKCITHGATFVNGGMNFTQSDQHLYFPKCGYYYISSQVVFQYYEEDNTNPNAPEGVQHKIEIVPNCRPQIYSTLFRSAHSNLARTNDIQTSTYIGDVVKMCEGGWIRVFIPEHNNLCCANGDGGTTHFSTFLIEETDCI